MLRTLVDHGINWNWYLQGDFDPEARTVELFYHQRHHKGDGGHPIGEQIRFDLLEDNRYTRTVTGVKIHGEDEPYKVINPRHSFDYRDSSNLQKG